MSNTASNGIANISACIEVPDGCHLECRIGAHETVEFTFGTWQGGAEIHFERYALERFMEPVTWALDPAQPRRPEEPAVPDGQSRHHINRQREGDKPPVASGAGRKVASTLTTR